eukprot:9239683-Alexandrium_andersonii.AAC.1
MTPAELLLPYGGKLQGNGHAAPAGSAGARPSWAPAHASEPLASRLSVLAKGGVRRAAPSDVAASGSHLVAAVRAPQCRGGLLLPLLPYCLCDEASSDNSLHVRNPNMRSDIRNQARNSCSMLRREETRDSASYRRIVAGSRGMPEPHTVEAPRMPES